MATSLYSTSLRLALPTTGDLFGTWGTEINNSITSMVDQAVAGRAVVNMASDANYTLTALNGTSDEARCAVLKITSGVSLTATRNVVVPLATKLWVVENATTGSQSIQVIAASGTGVTIPNGSTYWVRCDGTNVVASLGYFPAALGTALLPSYTFIGDPNTGMYSPGADQLAWSTAGVQRMSISASGEVTIDGLAVGKGPNGNFGNTVLGGLALAAITSGTSNTAIGSEAMDSLTTGSGNTAVGHSALGFVVGGAANTAVGSGALANAASSNNCVAVGSNAGQRQSSGSGHVFLGVNAGYENLTGTDNVFVGRNAGYESTGSSNTAVGQGAGYGTGAGALTGGDNNTLIGYRALPSTAITNNEMTLGNSSVATLRCQVTSITSLSDARDKTAVADLSFGLDFIASLRPVAFTWNTRDGAKVGIRSSGFIAQDLKAAQERAGAAEVLRLVYEENPEKLEANYGHLIPVLVKALQELKAEVDALRAQIG